MSVSVKTYVLLWKRAANRCAFLECREHELIIDATEQDDESLIGEACHIIAKSPAGPRGNSAVAPRDRDAYSNLILLCRNHHKMVDDQRNTFTPELLAKMKAEHEHWVKQTFGLDPKKQADEERFADIIDCWTEKVDLDNWRGWTSNLLYSGQPKLTMEWHERLREVKDWLFNRVWPERYPELKSAFDNFNRVLQDLLLSFDRHSEEHGSLLITRKFYKIDRWDPKLYKLLGDRYEYHVDLVEDLALELTRAANYVCDKVREFIDPGFRLKEGVLVCESGIYMDLTYHVHRVEYRNGEREKMPYPGLKKFKEIRSGRDYHFGSGEDPTVRSEELET